MEGRGEGGASETRRDTEQLRPRIWFSSNASSSARTTISEPMFALAVGLGNAMLQLHLDDLGRAPRSAGGDTHAMSTSLAAPAVTTGASFNLRRGGGAQGALPLG